VRGAIQPCGRPVVTQFEISASRFPLDTWKRRAIMEAWYSQRNSPRTRTSVPNVLQSYWPESWPNRQSRSSQRFRHILQRSDAGED